MKKVFKLEDLDCAACGMKMEDAIRKISGVSSVSVNFVAQKLTIEAEEADFERVLRQAAKLISRIEPDCRIVM